MRKDNQIGVQHHSLSTSLLAGAAILALTALLMLLPWDVLNAMTSEHTKPLDWVRVILFVGSPVWVMMFFLAARLIQNQRQTHVLNGTQRLVWAELPYPTLVENLRKHFPVLASVAMQIRGNVDSIHDPGGPLHISPRSYLLRGQRVLVFPAVLWKRLQQSPEALGAVLAHELAHFQHRDMEWLGMAQRLLWAVALVFLCNYLIDMYTSIHSDLINTVNGLAWSVVQASLAGKIFTFSGLMLLTLLAVYIRALEHWREALADFAAVSSQGEKALVSAECLISSASEANAKPMGMRPSRTERNASITLTPFHWLLLGAVVVIASINLLGQFAYLQRFEQHKSDWVGIYEWITAVLNNFLPYAGFLLLLRVIVKFEGIKIESDGRLDARSLALPALFLILGGSLGFVLNQALPLMLTSVSMPDGYDYVFKHDPGSLLISSTLSQLGLNAWLMVLALLGVVGTLVTGYWSIGWLLGLLWAGMSIAEQKVFPSIMIGGITPLLILIFAIPVLVIASRRNLLNPSLLWLPILGLASLYWVGLGDINHLAATSSNAAIQAEERGDWARAIELHRRAAFYAPGLAVPKLHLARALMQSGANLGEVIQVADAAIESPLTSSWQDRFLALKNAADLHLQRHTQLDLVQANHWYSQAEWLWRNNSRLPTDQVANLLYNQACAAMLQTGPSLKVVSGLLEALALDHCLANTMLQDEDLRALNLGAIPPLNRGQLQQVLVHDHINDSVEKPL